MRHKVTFDRFHLRETRYYCTLKSQASKQYHEYYRYFFLKYYDTLNFLLNLQL